MRNKLLIGGALLLLLLWRKKGQTSTGEPLTDSQIEQYIRANIWRITPNMGYSQALENFLIQAPAEDLILLLEYLQRKAKNGPELSDSLKMELARLLVDTQIVGCNFPQSTESCVTELFNRL